MNRKIFLLSLCMVQGAMGSITPLEGGLIQGVVGFIKDHPVAVCLGTGVVIGAVIYSASSEAKISGEDREEMCNLVEKIPPAVKKLPDKANNIRVEGHFFSSTGVGCFYFIHTPSEIEKNQGKVPAMRKETIQFINISRDNFNLFVLALNNFLKKNDTTLLNQLLKSYYRPIIFPDKDQLKAVM